MSVQSVLGLDPLGLRSRLTDMLFCAHRATLA
ncbi:hypothetical protein M2103_000574 [Ereboglobus sp. PH5-5]|nr:hypothetical protein [Ereboglobus sp. PH5-5]